LSEPRSDAASYGPAPSESTARTVAVLGLGRAGRALVRELVAADVAVVGAWNRSPGEPTTVPTSFGAEPPSALLAADVVLLAVADDALEAVLPTLALAPGSCVLHLSGARDSADLPRPATGHRGGWHPLQALARAPGALPVPPYAVALDGDPEAIAAGRWLAERLGHPAVQLTGSKAAYHASAVLASNLLVALEAVATRTMATVAGDEAWALLWPLVAGTLSNLEAGRFGEALTGPIPRGDAGTVRRNLAALGDDPEAAALYRQLGALALALVQDRLPPDRAAAVAAALNSAP
jgi:predicted short-subunit dehydrogenase-like oxidoreductase (DUF2520 family)